MRFSIIVPVYNSNEYLSECIDSVLAQGFRDWELILVDDGSVDGSGSTADRYAVSDDRIKVIHKENQGQLYARREGFAMATGDYIICLDSDDYWDTDTLSVINENIERYSPDFLIFPCRITGDPAKEGDIIGALSDRTGVITKSEVYEKIISAHLLNSMALKAFKRELWKGDDTDYSVFRSASYGEDKVQTLHLVTLAEKILYIAQPLYNYRCNPASVSNNMSLELISKKISNPMFEFVLEYMNRWGMTDRSSMNKLSAYYIHHFIAVIFSFRRNCASPDDIRIFRKTKWKKFLSGKISVSFFNPKLSLKDKVKLLLLFYFPTMI